MDSPLEHLATLNQCSVLLSGSLKETNYFRLLMNILRYSAILRMESPGRRESKYDPIPV